MIPTQEDFQRDLEARVRSAVHMTIQTVLEKELERLIRAGPYERSNSVSTSETDITLGAS